MDKTSRKDKTGKPMTLKQKLSMYFGSLLVLIVLVMVLAIAFKGKKLLEENTSEQLAIRAEYAAEIVNTKLDNSKQLLETIASSAFLKDSKLSIDEKTAKLQEMREQTTFTDIAYIEVNGTSHASTGDTRDVSQSPEVVSALAGKTAFSNLIRLETENVITVAAPVLDQNGTVIAVIEGVNQAGDYSDLLKELDADFFIIDPDGYYVAHVDPSMLEANNNPLESESEDAEIVHIYKNMVAGKSGFESFYNEFKKETQYMSYAPISETNWSISLIIERTEVIGTLAKLQSFLMILGVAGIVLGVVVVFFVASVISERIQKITKNLQVIAAGDFVTPMDDRGSNMFRETLEAKNALTTMRENLADMLLSVKTSIGTMEEQSNGLVDAAMNVQEGTENISESSNQVAAGVENQTTDLVEISQIVDNFGNEVEHIITSMKEVNEKSNRVGQIVLEGNEATVKLNQSVASTGKISEELQGNMDSLSQHLEQVNEITQLINSIADQTNLLALNASIEAARAGEAGKGFAVVADEIRSLAEQVKVSSININELIDALTKEKDVMNQSSNAMKNELEAQLLDIKSTVERYRLIAEQLNEMNGEMSDVNHAAQNIGQSKNQIISRITNATAVAEEVSASAQEIAASTESNSQTAVEVNDMANRLKEVADHVAKEAEKFRVQQ